MSRKVMQQSFDAHHNSRYGAPCNRAEVRDAVTALREELAKPEQTLTDADIEKIWIAYRAALPRYLCFARAVIKANNTKEKA